MTGIGGVFFRAKDPAALRQWYADHLGIEATDFGSVFTWEGDGYTVWSPFDHDTDYFGPSGQQLMINYRVDNVDAMLEQLRAAGVEVVDAAEEMEGVGLFGWAVDPEGNRFELFQPAAD